MILRTVARVLVCLALMLIAPVWGSGDIHAAPASQSPASPDLAGLSKIATGYVHTCAVTIAGSPRPSPPARRSRSR